MNTKIQHVKVEPDVNVDRVIPLCSRQSLSQESEVNLNCDIQVTTHGVDAIGLGAYTWMHMVLNMKKILGYDDSDGNVRWEGQKFDTWGPECKILLTPTARSKLYGQE